jgi:hypothetical protein
MTASINGKQAVEILQSMKGRVSLHRRDKTNKLHSYKLNGAKRSEFAFDPKTKNGLYVWVDRMPPAASGLCNVEMISSENCSTALARVFSGGVHTARFKVDIADAAALEAFIAYCEGV